MPFTINIQNNGVDGTIQVKEALNENQMIDVLNDILSAGEVRSVVCPGESPKDFTWTHWATNLTGGPETKADGETLVVES